MSVIMIQSTSSQSDSTTASAASPPPISPFSSNSLHSEATSDEHPDLGAFTTVFRALNHLQPPRSFAIPIPRGRQTETNSSSVPITQSSEPDSDAPGRILAAYFQPSRNGDGDTEEASEDLSASPSDEEEDSSGSGSRSGSGSDTEGEPENRTVEIEGFSDLDADGQPSLGYLDEALSFIASERARIAAQRDKGATAENAWKHVIEPRRKRRRKKSRPRQLLRSEDDGGEAPTETTEAAGDLDAEDSSSSLDIDSTLSSSYPYHKSTPGTPSRTAKDKRRQRKGSTSTTDTKLRHTKSTPNLDLTISAPIDPRILQLRSLTHKLRLLFQEDSAVLSTLLSGDFPGSSNFVDPRGPVPGPQDTLIHVFIDHSNILIGLLTYLKRYHRNIPRSKDKPKHMSHAALALILERGRPVTRRCVVTSSPLYQPMESAERLGYEVRVYARVPDMGDGDDRRKSVDFGSGTPPGAGSGMNGYKGHFRNRSGSTFRKGHGKKGSGNTSTESDHGGSLGNAASFPQAFIRSLGSQTNNTRASGTGTGAGSQQQSSNGTPTTTTNNGTRIRYREQGVDELLQLKLHQAIADVDTPPPNATIVLATGDGNVGQFNEDGFLGPVRTALKKGWKVELYAWEEGLSKAWMREFGEGPWKDRFKVIGMETFGVDLLEV